MTNNVLYLIYRKKSGAIRPILVIWGHKRYDLLMKARIVARFGEPMSASKTVSNMELADVQDELLRATKEYIDLLKQRKQALTGAPAEVATTKTDAAPDDMRLVKWPLTDVMPIVLELSDEPQTAKQIVATLKRVGREFESDNPVRAVRAALKKAMAANPDVYTIGWAKYFLRSKSTRKTKQVEKAFAKTNGTGGRSNEEHGRRTAEGIAKRREGVAKWGRAKKLTPERVEEAKEMLRNGVTLREVSRKLNVSIPVMYESGIRQRELKREGELRQKELALGGQKETDSVVVRFAKS